MRANPKNEKARMMDCVVPCCNSLCGLTEIEKSIKDHCFLTAAINRMGLEVANGSGMAYDFRYVL
jgi:hypothetical protein